MRQIFILLLYLIHYQSNAAVIVRQVDPLLKVLPGSNLPSSFSVVQAVAKNDNVTFQLVMLSDIDEEVYVSLSSQSLNSSLLSNVKSYKVGFVKVTNNMFNHGADFISSPNKMYPDPLIPAFGFLLNKNQVQPIVLDLGVTNTFPTGLHTIVVSVVSGMKVIAITEITFEVFNVQISSQRLNYVNWYHDGNFEKMNSGEAVADFSPLYWTIFKNTVQVAKDFGQNCFAINPLFLTRFKKKGNTYEFDFTHLNKAINIILHEVKMDYVIARQFGIRMAGWESEFGLQMPDFYGEGLYMMKNRTLKQKEARDFYDPFLKNYFINLKEKGFLAKILQHVADEPVISNVQSYIEIARFVKSVAPGLKIIEASITPSAFPYIDIIVIPFGELPNVEKEIAALKKMPGKEIWLYTSSHPQGDWANRFIEQPLIKTQLLPWISIKYNFTGYLHWGLNFWSEEPFGETSFPPYNLPGGDSYIVYPGYQSIIPSIRFVAMRNGLNDVALFNLLQTKNLRAANNIIDNLIKGYSNYNTSTINYYKQKRELLSTLSTR